MSSDKKMASKSCYEHRHPLANVKVAMPVDLASLEDVSAIGNATD